MASKPNWRIHIFDALNEIRSERFGRPALADDDRDLIDIIEDLMDMAYREGRTCRRRLKADLHR